MHIKELVLDNFKSFGRKTRIPFYEDFTTVSGPNGSGKSNIIDAVLFALGLARTSGIRAEKLTDLIYNPGHADDDVDSGGEREASVEVILDNGDGTLSRSQVVTAAGTENVGDVDEISIRRRVKETDDNYYSYYYINGRSVNLSDIRDLLAQALVAPEALDCVGSSNAVFDDPGRGPVLVNGERRGALLDDEGDTVVVGGLCERLATGVAFVWHRSYSSGYARGDVFVFGPLTECESVAMRSLYAVCSRFEGVESLIRRTGHRSRATLLTPVALGLSGLFSVCPYPVLKQPLGQAWTVRGSVQGTLTK